MKKAINILLCLALILAFSAASVSGAELHPFADLNYNSWYEDGIMYVYEKGIMRGTSKAEFSPNENTTRAMIVTILYRLEGSQDGNNTSSFTDVPADEWYADAVAWAARENIVNGYGNGTFGPQDCITRQQLAAILYRYSAYKGVSASANGWTSSYPDADNVSAWALPAMQWAVQEQFITGNVVNGQVFLQPDGFATRAQIAAILMRYLCRPTDETINIAALEAYGREYAASLGFTIDTTMLLDNSSYYPGDRVPLWSMEDARRLVRDNVRATASNLIACDGSIEGFRSNILIEKDGEDGYVIWVMYG